MNEMVERVATAIQDQLLLGVDPRLLARAAIAAMREPTDAMVYAGQQEELSRMEDVTAIYSAMIDAALKE